MTRRRGFVVHAPLLAPHRDDRSATSLGRSCKLIAAGDPPVYIKELDLRIEQLPSRVRPTATI